jgi:hypothetical protein
MTATLMRYSFRFPTVLFLLLFLAASAFAQSPSPTNKQPDVTPETAFVSPSKYTNAFFGFSLPLPQGAPLQELSIPSHNASSHFLFGLKALRHGLLTAMTIMATKSEDASADDAREAASRGQKERSVKRIEIGGREFWKSESQEKGQGGKMRSVHFATALDGYVLQFNIDSFDAKLTDELQHSIEAVTFFDPAKAEEVAGPGSRAYHPAASHSPQ